MNAMVGRLIVVWSRSSEDGADCTLGDADRLGLTGGGGGTAPGRPTRRLVLRSSVAATRARVFPAAWYLGRRRAATGVRRRCRNYDGSRSLGRDRCNLSARRDRDDRARMS